jgi:hypothetical protein
MNLTQLTQHNGFTTPAFWECECKTNYLHHKQGFVSSCSLCGVSSEEGADAILDSLIYPNALVFLKSNALYPKYYELVGLYSDLLDSRVQDDVTVGSHYLARLRPAKITNGTQIYNNESHSFIMPTSSIAGFVHPSMLCGNVFNYIMEDKVEDKVESS